MDKQLINTLEEFEDICVKNTSSIHYHPESYLMKYNFSINILLDVFCTDYMEWSFEDNYYNDFCLDMVIKYQPHIDIDKYKNLLKDLNDVFELVKRSELVLEFFNKNKQMNRISCWKYDFIDEYYKYLEQMNNDNREKIDDIIINDYINLLQTNKYCLIKKLYNSDEKIISKEELIIKVKQIFNDLPKYEYSSILPI
jgi:hypothetical protein